MASKSHDKAPAGKLQPGSPSEPAVFGKYYLHGLIARGGMAEVYRARPREENEPQLHAIKVMRPQLAREPRFVEMFTREGKVAMLLSNQSIVRTFEVGRIDGRHYIDMEYIGGKDLTQCLRRCQENTQRIPVPHAVYITARIVEGLGFAHRLCDGDGKPLGIRNRDVSPSNVRLSYDGEVKILDFGIAHTPGMKFTSEIGILKGKFSYMSPEQIRGMPLDARTDVFSAGIILHEMLTTEKLFRGDTEFELMEKVRKAQIEPPSKFNRRVTDELDRISLKALARDVEERYQSAAEFQADLEKLLDKYRFDPKELRQFMRQLFRKEYAHEQTETSTALRSVPASGRKSKERAAVSPPSSQPSSARSTNKLMPTVRPAAEPAPPSKPPAAAESAAEPAPAADAAEKPRGLLARLFGKKR